MNATKQKEKRKYLRHFSHALAKVVPPDETGNSEIGGWKFNYKGWMSDYFDHQTYERDDASQMSLTKPESCFVMALWM